MDWQAAADTRADSRLSIHSSNVSHDADNQHRNHQSEVPSTIKSEPHPDEDWDGLGGVDDTLEADVDLGALEIAQASGWRATPDDAEDLLLQGIGKAMLGVSLLYRGRSGAEAGRTWALVGEKGKQMDKIRVQIAEQSPGGAEDMPDKQLLFDLNLQAKKIDYQSKMLRCIDVYKKFLPELCSLVQNGPEYRQRVLRLGGADLLVAATAFVRDEALLESCINALRHLCLEDETRRYLIKDRVDCVKALAGVLSVPHRSTVIEHAIEAIILLCLKHNVTHRMVELGVLNAVIKLACTAGAKNVAVLQACARLSKIMAQDITCCPVMTEKAPSVAQGLFRVLKLCDDAVIDAATTLEALCVGSNRLVFGRHKDLAAVCVALERCALDPSRHEQHMVAVAQFVIKIATIKEIRLRLLDISVGKWLVSMVFTHLHSEAAAHAAQMCIKTLEVDEEGIRSFDAAVKERLLQAPEGSVAGSVRSMYSIERSERAPARMHWSDKIMQMHAAGARSTRSSANSGGDLMHRYLREQAVADVDEAQTERIQQPQTSVWASQIPGTPSVLGTPLEPATPIGTPPASVGRASVMSIATSEKRREQMRKVLIPDPTISEDSVALPSQAMEAIKNNTKFKGSGAATGSMSLGLHP